MGMMKVSIIPNPECMIFLNIIYKCFIIYIYIYYKKKKYWKDIYI